MKFYVVVGVLAALALQALAAEESSPAPVAAATTSVGTKSNVLNYGNIHNIIKFFSKNLKNLQIGVTTLYIRQYVRCF